MSLYGTVGARLVPLLPTPTVTLTVSIHFRQVLDSLRYRSNFDVLWHYYSTRTGKLKMNVLRKQR